MKRDKKLLAKEIEERMDRGFKKFGKNIPHVYHFRDVPPFNAVTVVTAMPFRWEKLASIVSKYPQFPHLFNPATYLLQNLATVHNLHGVAICDTRDTFSRQEGRCRAKRRLLRHLKGRGGNSKKHFRIEDMSAYCPKNDCSECSTPLCDKFGPVYEGCNCDECKTRREEIRSRIQK